MEIVSKKFEKIIKQIKMDSYHSLIIRTSVFFGNSKAIDIRIFRESDNFKGYLKKGITIPYKFFEEVKEGINQINSEDFNYGSIST